MIWHTAPRILDLQQIGEEAILADDAKIKELVNLLEGFSTRHYKSIRDLYNDTYSGIGKDPFSKEFTNKIFIKEGKEPPFPELVQQEEQQAQSPVTTTAPDIINVSESNTCKCGHNHEHAHAQVSPQFEQPLQQFAQSLYSAAQSGASQSTLMDMAFDSLAQMFPSLKSKKDLFEQKKQLVTFNEILPMNVTPEKSPIVVPTVGENVVLDAEGNQVKPVTAQQERQAFKSISLPKNNEMGILKPINDILGLSNIKLDIVTNDKLAKDKSLICCTPKIINGKVTANLGNKKLYVDQDGHIAGNDIPMAYINNLQMAVPLNDISTICKWILS